MATLAYIGPVELDLLGDFLPRRDGDPTDVGNPVAFGGVIRAAQAEQLKELVGNTDRRRTYGPHEGIIEPIWVQNRPEMFSFYILTRFDQSADHLQQLRGWSSFQMSAVQVPELRVVITRTARIRTDDFAGVTPRSLLAQPFWSNPEATGAWEIEPNGTAFTREYDPRTKIDIVDLTETGRDLSLREGVLS